MADGVAEGMRFEVADGVPGELGARLEDVAQEAIDATATAYTADAHLDVAEFLRTQLHARGVAAADEETLAEVAHLIRSGHHVAVGESDGSVARDDSV